MAASFLEQGGVFLDLAAEERAQSRSQIASKSAAPHDDSEALTLDLANTVTGDVFSRDHKHV
jgi:hypothetical protein